jgi:phage-related protein
MKSTVVRSLSKGRKYEICDITIRGKSLVERFIDGLGKEDQQKFTALLQRTSNEGLPANREKFKKLEDDLFEFKSFQVRVFCTVCGKRIILIHGVIKKKNRHDQEDIDKAKRLLAEAGLDVKKEDKNGKQKLVAGKDRKVRR